VATLAYKKMERSSFPVILYKFAKLYKVIGSLALAKRALL
jgi:hypothetical protein